MIYITGDTHGVVDIERLSEKRFPEQRNLTRSDYVIICGDFGCVWAGNEMDDPILDWLRERNFTTLFVDGNHENFSALNSYPIEQWHGGKVHFIRPNVIHLMRGQVYKIGSHTFFTMGGAASTDRDFRIEGRSWWPQEMPSEEEYAEAEHNLAQHNYMVDYIITHTAPCSLVPILLDPHAVPDQLTRFLDGLTRRVLYRHWYFGHLHLDKDMLNFSAMYNRLVPLDISDTLACDPADSAASAEGFAEENEPSGEDICECGEQYSEAASDRLFFDDYDDILFIAGINKTIPCRHFIAVKGLFLSDSTAEETASQEDDEETADPVDLLFLLFSAVNRSTDQPWEDECFDALNSGAPVIRGIRTNAVCTSFTARKNDARHSIINEYTEETTSDTMTFETVIACRMADKKRNEDDTDLTPPFFGKAKEKPSSRRYNVCYLYDSCISDGTGAFDLTKMPSRYVFNRSAQQPVRRSKATAAESSNAAASGSDSKTPLPLFLAYCAFSAIALILVVAFMELRLGFLSFLEDSLLPLLITKIGRDDLRTYALGGYLGITFAAAMAVKKRSMLSAFNTASIPLLLCLSIAAVCADFSLIKYALVYIAIILAFAITYAAIDFSAEKKAYNTNVRCRKFFSSLPAAKKPSFIKSFINNACEIHSFHYAAMLSIIIMLFAYNPLGSRIADDYIVPEKIVEAARPACYITSITPSNNVNLSYNSDSDPNTAQLAQFNHHSWSSLTALRRLDTLQAIINMEATVLRLPHAVSVECTRFDDGRSAVYDSARRIITVSDDLLMDDDLSALLRSVLYQCRCAYQYDRIHEFFGTDVSNALTKLSKDHTYPLWLESVAIYASVNFDKSAAECMEHFAQQLDSDASMYSQTYLGHYLWRGSHFAALKGIAEEQTTTLPDGNSLSLHFYSDSIAVFRGTMRDRYELVDIIRPESTITADQAAAAIIQSLGGDAYGGTATT